MKKLALGLLCLTLIFCCTSCELLFAILDGVLTGYESVDYETETYELDKTKSHIYVQQNKNNNQIIPKNCVAYCEYGSTRNIVEEENNLLSEPSDIKNILFQYENTSFLTEQRLRDEYDEMVQNESRASYLTYYDPPEQGYFYLLDQNDEKTSNLRQCKLGYQSLNCNVWYYENSNLITTSYITICKKIGVKFDYIRDIEESIMGAHTYTSSEKVYSNHIDSQNKINIVVFDIFGDSSKDQNGGTFGYFNQVDYSRTSRISNQKPIIYVDSYFFTKSEDMVYSTLVHEYNHLLNFVNKTVKNGLTMETWYTEMLSMIAEDAFQQYLGISDLDSPKSRLTSCVLGYNGNELKLYPNNANTTGFVFNYNKGITNWKNDNVLISYANTYAFGAYLVRNFGGFNLLKNIATNGYVNQESINQALAKMNISFGSKNNWTFNDLVEQEYNILLNNSSSSQALSLNKMQIYSNDSSIRFNPINIYEMKYYSKTNDNSLVEMGPINIEQDVINFVLHGCDRNSRRDIGPNGFDISYIPKGYSSVDIEVPVINNYSLSVYEY